MKYSEIAKILKRNGCKLIKHGANHDKWYSEKTDRQFTIPRHGSQEAKVGTIKSISKQAGVKL